MVFRFFVFLGFATFFLVMNVLLWRWEVSGRNKPGAAVPLEAVWEKITAAPDNSSLEIRQRGKKIGYCRWSPSVGDDLASGRRMLDELPPEGMVHAVTGYNIDFDGSFAWEGSDRINFFFRTRLGTNQVWQELFLRAKYRTESYVFQAQAATEQITLAVEGAQAKLEQHLTFAEARDPEQLVRRFGGPLLAELAKATGKTILGTNQWSGNLDLNWTARHDRMRVGRSRIRVYRIEAKLLGTFQIVVLVSSIGEILRVELPNQIVLINDAFLNL